MYITGRREPRCSGYVCTWGYIHTYMDYVVPYPRLNARLSPSDQHLEVELLEA